MRSNLTLDQAFRSLRNAADDLSRQGWKDGQTGFRRLLSVLEAEPLGGILRAHLPPFDFDSWWAEAQTTGGSMVGSKRLAWPLDMAALLAARIAFCRAMSEDGKLIYHYIIRFIGTRGSIEDRFQEMIEKVVAPLVRDVERMAVELRVPPPFIDDMLASPLPTSGDAEFDRLLVLARDKFRDPSPAVRSEALQHLWDAWERMKTILPGKKLTSIAKLLDIASPEPTFRAVLEAEALALTKIGNDFHIRHFETYKAPLPHPEQVDYLTHRCFALVWLLLQALNRTEPQ